MTYLLFLYQIAPIAICAGIMLLLKNAKLSGQKIAIKTGPDDFRSKETESSGAGDAALGNQESQNSNESGTDNARQTTFIRAAYDGPILNGASGVLEMNPEEIKRAAFEKLSLTDICDLKRLGSDLKRSSKKSVQLFFDRQRGAVPAHCKARIRTASGLHDRLWYGCLQLIPLSILQGLKEKSSIFIL